MNLTSDQQILPGKKWPRSVQWAIALAMLPALLYMPGLSLGISQGIATSLPFWARAKDYTCSSGTVESLMVRVSPYVDPRAVAPQKDEWGCKRIAVLSDEDLGRPGSLDPEAKAWYVRIYTPAKRAEFSGTSQASLQSDLLNLPLKPVAQLTAPAAPTPRVAAPALREASACVTTLCKELARLGASSAAQRSSQQASP